MLCHKLSLSPDNREEYNNAATKSIVTPSCDTISENPMWLTACIFGSYMIYHAHASVATTPMLHLLSNFPVLRNKRSLLMIFLAGLASNHAIALNNS